MKHNLKVGDILVSTWGYDACLATFSKVLKVTPKSATIAELKDQNREGDWVSGYASPAAGSRLGPLKNARVSEYGVKDINGHYARLWDGEKVRTYNHH